MIRRSAPLLLSLMLACGGGGAHAQVVSSAMGVMAIQGHAAQVSGNIRGAITGQGTVAEAQSSHDTQRAIQGDRVDAARANQFSTPLCQDATGATQAIAMAAQATPTEILMSRANAMRTSGYQRPENPLAAVMAVNTAFQERRPLYCDPNDPACRGATGQRPQGDRMPGAVLDISRFDTAADRTQAAWVIQNLTQPVPVVAMTARQAETAAGQEAYLRRGSYEAQLNLAKDVVADILLTRREATGDAHYYNALAAEAGLPQASGGVSLEDMDRMRFRDRFNAAYSARLANLGDRTVLLRSVASLRADLTQLRHRTNELLEKRAMLRSSVVSLLLERKLAAAGGALN